MIIASFNLAVHAVDKIKHFKFWSVFVDIRVAAGKIVHATKAFLFYSIVAYMSNAVNIRLN